MAKNSKKTVATILDIASGKSLLYAGIGAAFIGGTGFLLWRESKKGFQRTTENKLFDRSDNQGTAEFYARRINSAFGIFIDDDDIIFQTIRDIPSRDMWEQVKNAYAKMFNENLIVELEDQMSLSEMIEIQEIINAKI